jgi:dTDP-4-amino-4,6-dideoxygalactose transaminase
MLVSNNGDHIEHARKLSTQAREPAPHYQHTELGFNYRLSNILAALGRAQLEVLPDRVATRRRLRERYRQQLGSLAGISFMPESPEVVGNAWLTCILISPEVFGVDREAIRVALEAADIEARPLWKPMHLQPYYADRKMYGGDVSAEVFARGLCLPSGSSLSQDDQDRVIEIVRGCARNA